MESRPSVGRTSPARTWGTEHLSRTSRAGLSVSLFQVGVVGEGEEWLLVHQLPNEPDARSMEVPELNPFTYYR